ncbi:MAG: hypothetical protein ACK5UE_06370 [Chitinophagales bacterium]|jgi:hypothetical protein|nr:hypothetical protein [Sphingobacteriales bacterium]
MVKREAVILGMAKSSVKLRGGSVRNLELDILKIIFALNYKGCNKKKTAFFIVHNEEVKNRILLWVKKYGHEEDNIIIQICDGYDKKNLIKRDMITVSTYKAQPHMLIKFSKNA